MSNSLDTDQKAYSVTDWSDLGKNCFTKIISRPQKWSPENSLDPDQARHSDLIPEKKNEKNYVEEYLQAKKITQKFHHTKSN